MKLLNSIISFFYILQNDQMTFTYFLNSHNKNKELFASSINN